MNLFARSNCSTVLATRCRVAFFVALPMVWLAVLVTPASVAAMGGEDDVNHEPKPNIVVLFADDAGYADFGFQPNVSEDMAGLTPHIDRLAAAGARLTNAYMSGAVCSPSRAGLLTGRYQGRFGHENNIPPGFMREGLPLTETLMPDRLGDLGYHSGLVGKWHLGYPDRYQPNDRGFDWFYGCLQGSRSYFPMDAQQAERNEHRVFLENKTPTAEGGYTTDRIGDAACRFIRDNRQRPFFLFVSFTAPHGPLQPKPDDLLLDELKSIEPARRQKYAGLVKSLDDNVGKILSALDDTGLSQQTIVVFTNDNGGQTQTGANNDPLRGRKGMMYEGGIRVPWVVRWPGVVDAGTVVDDPVISLDLLPTFVAAAGGEVDKQWALDGVDLGPRLSGALARMPERTLFWRKNGSQGDIACRRGDWKVVHRRSDSLRPELYDLSSDLSESTDAADQEPEVVEGLLAEIRQWESELEKPRWGPGS